jgi:hypothetical protein
MWRKMPSCAGVRFTVIDYAGTKSWEYQRDYLTCSFNGGDTMRKIVGIGLIFCLVLDTTALAGLGSKKAAYQGGTTKDKDFPGAKEAVIGTLDTGNEKELKFEYRLNNVSRVYSIPYHQFLDIEYGQKAGRRVGAAVATSILLTPVGLFLLFSKKRKHFVTIGYKDNEGKEQAAVFELGKDIVRTTLPILEARSGKKITYQDEEAEKSSKGK